MQSPAEIKTQSKAHKVLPYVLMVLWAMLFRLWVLVQPQRIVWGDEPFYLWLGRNWFTGAGYSFTGYSDVHHTPMYPFLSGVFYLLTGNLELASNICYLLFGTLLVIPVFLLARELYGRSVGYVSAILVAIYPAVATAPLYWGTLTEPPYYLFVYSALWLALLAIRRERAWWAYLGAGALFGLAYLTRPEAIAYVAVVGAVLVFVRLVERRLFARSALAGLALFAVGFLVFFGSYAYYVYRETGSWMVSEKAGVTFITCIGLSEGDTAAFDRATWGLDTTGLEVFFFSRESYHVSMIDIIRAQPDAFVALVTRNIRRFVGSLLSTRLFSFYLLPLMGLAFLKKAWDKPRFKGELLLLGSLVPVSAFLLFFIQDRYIATLLPTLIIWLGLGTHEIGVWLRDTVSMLAEGHWLPGKWRSWAPSIPAIVLVLALLVLQPRTIAQYTNIGSFRPAHKMVGLWMADMVTSDSVVMSRYPTIAFYAGSRWEPTPNAEYAQVLTYAKANHVDYFVLDELETKELRPQLAWLLDESAAPAELEVVQTFPSAQGKMIIYRLK